MTNCKWQAIDKQRTESLPIDYIDRRQTVLVFICLIVLLYTILSNYFPLKDEFEDFYRFSSLIYTEPIVFTFCMYLVSNSLTRMLYELYHFYL